MLGDYVADHSTSLHLTAHKAAEHGGKTKAKTQTEHEEEQEQEQEQWNVQQVSLLRLVLGGERAWVCMQTSGRHLQRPNK